MSAMALIGLHPIQNLLSTDDIGVLCAHVHQTDSMACLIAVKASIGHNCNLVVGTKCIHHACPHASRGRTTREDQTVAAKEREVGLQGRTEKGRWLLLEDHQITCCGLDRTDDGIWVTVIDHRPVDLPRTGMLPKPRSHVPTVLTP